MNEIARTTGGPAPVERGGATSVTGVGVAGPTAWIAFACDGSESRAVFLSREAADEAAKRYGWFVAELWVKPTLSPEERDAVRWAGNVIPAMAHKGAAIAYCHAETLRKLDERLG